MSTVSISLTNDQLKLIDKLSSLHGFANRSEFFRALIRLITQKPRIVEDASLFPFSVPTTQSKSKIVSDFKKTNKYSASFLKDLEEGLDESTYFSS